MNDTMNLRCPTCRKPLLIWRGQDKRILRTRIVIFDNGTCFSKCPFCKSEVVVPIKLLDELADGPVEKRKGTAKTVGGSSGPRTCGTPSFEQLVRDLEGLLTPVAAHVETTVGKRRDRTTGAQLEKIRGCLSRIRQVTDLVERQLNNHEANSVTAEVSSRRPQSRMARKTKKGSSPEARSVLVIDGDTGVKEFFRLSLGLTGAKVEFTDSGEEGIKLVRSQQFDAAFIEIMLPTMTGFKVLEEIKKHDARSDTVVYMMTKSPKQRHIDVSARLGARGVIDKAVSLKDVTVLLQEALQGKSSGIVAKRRKKNP